MGGAKELFRLDNRLHGTMSPLEFTAIKLVLSSLSALIMACVLENGHLMVKGGASEPWWLGLAQYPMTGLAWLLLGSIFVLIFQVNITWLAGLTSATTVGIAGGVKVVPQWILNALFNLKIDASPLNLAGAGLTLAASVLYATAAAANQRLVLTRGGFKWQSRTKAEDKLTVSLSGTQASITESLEDGCSS